ncbi:acyl-CoA dehydrogenase family protein [Streptomyces sp. NPDC056194]|uniref:acyl-CoA dehydrogenase family protein n=1 Tax=unclassified Streptomyces TaxID=2593676 RepID=UPI0035DFC362
MSADLRIAAHSHAFRCPPLSAVRALAHHALGLRRAGQPHTAQAAMLKWWAPQVAMAAVNDCVVLHGHIGWSEEMPLQ